MFNVRIKIISEVRIVAHLWPPWFRGVSSCWVNVLINQFCREISRLFWYRLVGAGTKIQGRVSAIAIRGIPRYVGLINWSNRFSAMVSFRC